ncbi:MAG: putative collagen-binding domain-containing protein, partial [Pirellulaceae bacterium]
AADGNAAQTGASRGNQWRVHFVPDAPGDWTYAAVFVAGPGAATVAAGGGLESSGGAFTVTALPALPAIPTGDRDLQSRGFLRHTGGRYYQFSGTGELFLKGGADSPENLLAYADFDGTFDTDGLQRDGEAGGGKFLHRYEPHVRDWRAGDPTWGTDERGKGLIGALNYLASKSMNSVYFIPYNLDGGDGKDTWPWIDPASRTRFDVSKLAQWQIVFDHMDRLGLMAHIITQETENDQALDGGELGPTRKLYYRELIARFGHKRLLTWNLGEENTNTPEQLRDFTNFIRTVDPNDHPIIVHTFPGKYDAVYAPLLGNQEFDGASLQMNKTGSDTHAETIKWIDRSTAAGWTWLVCLDEYGHGANGVKPDAMQDGHDEARKNCLWANLMAGGAGVEWYFGYQFPHNDLHCEDWRSRDHLWDMTRLALDFFHTYLPFSEMSHADELTVAPDDFCFAQPGVVYAIYLPHGGSTTLDLQQHDREFEVRWFDPRLGGDLQGGSVATVRGPSMVDLGTSPGSPRDDWVVLVRAR